MAVARDTKLVTICRGQSRGQNRGQKSPNRPERTTIGSNQVIEMTKASTDNDGSGTKGQRFESSRAYSSTMILSRFPDGSELDGRLRIRFQCLANSKRANQSLRPHPEHHLLEVLLRYHQHQPTHTRRLLNTGRY